MRSFGGGHDESTINKLLRDAARWGAAWPADMLDGPGIIAQLCALLALARGRGKKLAKSEGTLRPIMDVLAVVDGIQHAVHRTPGLRSEAVRAAEQLNSLAILLRSFAVMFWPDKESDARSQFMSWWGIVGDCLYGYISEVVPAAMEEQVPTLITEIVRQMREGLAVPVVVTRNDAVGGGPLAAFAGDAGSSGHSGGSSDAGPQKSATQRAVQGGVDAALNTNPYTGAANTVSELATGKTLGEHAEEAATSRGYISGPPANSNGK